jgi:hypothetical protein
MFGGVLGPDLCASRKQPIDNQPTIGERERLLHLCILQIHAETNRQLSGQQIRTLVLDPALSLLCSTLSLTFTFTFTFTSPGLAASHVLTLICEPSIWIRPVILPLTPFTLATRPRHPLDSDDTVTLDCSSLLSSGLLLRYFILKLFSLSLSLSSSLPLSLPLLFYTPPRITNRQPLNSHPLRVALHCIIKSFRHPLLIPTSPLEHPPYLFSPSRTHSFPKFPLPSVCRTATTARDTLSLATNQRRRRRRPQQQHHLRPVVSLLLSPSASHHSLRGRHASVEEHQLSSAISQSLPPPVPV